MDESSQASTLSLSQNMRIKQGSRFILPPVHQSTTITTHARNKRLLTPRTVISHRDAAQPSSQTPQTSIPQSRTFTRGDWSLVPCNPRR
ncbi:hypothetical protein CORC01_11307 [Colletotrichum orchidophilum]|uniref:Uncharacterized protein n=1 Tax=Colletotrichum orchidophilum TaxID=1209926 RepID=A0A1G4AW21_9PEZI|nr:uncharacterized protein CORC01_11307 [Colletotrichum orchidophilum]OHE93358.1 hypothetical protein CORC01_11307 [Colletotrichum orchidophilum]